MWKTRAVVATLGVALAGCSSSDSGVVDAAPDAIVEDVAQDAPDETSSPDVRPDSAPEQGVDAKEPVELACDPALTIEPLKLHADYCVISRAPVAGLPMAFNLRDDHVWTYEGRTAEPKDWHVDRWTLDGSTALEGPEPVFTFTPIIDELSDKVFSSEYVSLSPSELAAVGYTSNVTFAGEVIWGDASGTEAIDAKGNYWVQFLDDQTLLINGLGAGDAQQDQAVYLVKDGQDPRVLIEDIGILSGPLAIGETLVFAGGLFGTKNKTFAFTRESIDQAIAGNETLTATVDGFEVFEGSQLGTTALGDDLVVMVMDATLVFEGIRRYETVRDGDAVSVGKVTDIITPFGSLVVGRIAGDGQRLGLLLRESLDTEIAIVQPKK